MSYRHEITSPVGPLVLLGNGTALTALHYPGHPSRPETGVTDDARPFSAVVTELEEYFAGERTTFDVPLAPRGTPFQLACWAALQQIPYGQTRSYGEIAADLGQPGAARAVGLANNRNPISIIVPCHRVIGADGSLTGYGGGTATKRYLLDLEQRGSTLF